MVIWKYPVPVQDEFVIIMPSGAFVRAVQMQHDKPFIWAEVDPAADPTPRRFAIYGTGKPMADIPHQRYIGTFQVFGGDLVFHLYEV